MAVRRPTETCDGPHTKNIHPGPCRPASQLPGRVRRQDSSVRLFSLSPCFLALNHVFIFRSFSNLKHAFNLANIVSDSRFGLYEDFISDGTQRMEDYLRGVRQAILRGLENGGSDPLRPLRVIS